MAKFSRSSTAYKQDGSVVAAGVPRFETDGVMVEEGTTNLLPIANQNKLVNGTPNPNLYQMTTGLVQGGKYTLSGKKRIFADDLTINTRTGIAFYYSDSSVTHSETAWSLPKDGLFYDFTITGTADSAKTLTKVAFWILDYSSSTFMHEECQNVIAEAKPYATSFHPTTRTAESLTIPASAIPVSEGTIEFDCYPCQIWSTLANYMQALTLYADASNWILIRKLNNGLLLATNIDGVTSNISGGTVLQAKNRMALRYKDNVISLYLAGSKIAEYSASRNILASIVSVYLGSSQNKVAQVNALFSNLRISNKARSDAELANNGALSVDEYTTYFLGLQGNLSATCHPVMLVQGQGQVLLSRVGRGTRSIKVQGSGQVKLKRSAQYYPTIAVGTKGEVQLSRQGIGYRKMKVEGQGSFKIQEPNIEIYPEIREREAKTTLVERESATEVIGVPYAGDTIKIKGTFKSFEGVAADPASITLKIYDTINNLLSTISVTATDKVSAGVYEVNYTVPDGYQALYYEWHCVQGDSPQVTMGKITVLKRGQV